MSVTLRFVFTAAIAASLAIGQACNDDDPIDPPPGGDSDNQVTVDLLFVHGAVGVGEVQLRDADGVAVGAPVAFGAATRATVEVGAPLFAQATDGRALVLRFDVSAQVGAAHVTYVLAGTPSPVTGQRGVSAIAVPQSSGSTGMVRVVNAIADEETITVKPEGGAPAPTTSGGYSDIAATGDTTHLTVGTLGGDFPLQLGPNERLLLLVGTYQADLTSAAFVRGLWVSETNGTGAQESRVVAESQVLSTVLDGSTSYSVGDTPLGTLTLGAISEGLFTSGLLRVSVAGTRVFEESAFGQPQSTLVYVAAGLVDAGSGQRSPEVFTLDTGSMHAQGGVYVAHAVADASCSIGLRADGTDVASAVAFGTAGRATGTLAAGNHTMVTVLCDVTGDGAADSLTAEDFSTAGATQLLVVTGTVALADDIPLRILAFDRTPLGTLTATVAQ